MEKKIIELSLNEIEAVTGGVTSATLAALSVPVMSTSVTAIKAPLPVYTKPTSQTIKL